MAIGINGIGLPSLKCRGGQEVNIDSIDKSIVIEYIIGKRLYSLFALELRAFRQE